MYLKMRYLLRIYSLRVASPGAHDKREGGGMIVFDFGRFGKASITRPTLLEIVALIVFLAFAVISIWALR
jgi:hypothetical protein